MPLLTRFAIASVFLLGLCETVCAQRYVPTPDTLFPRLKYADSLVSLNDRCAVRHAHLNPKIAPVYVNGKPIGFC